MGKIVLRLPTRYQIFWWKNKLLRFEESKIHAYVRDNFVRENDKILKMVRQDFYLDMA